MMTYCTLFDSKYLDKGLVTYRSLEATSDDFCLYIFCFDEKCFEVLDAMRLPHVKLVHEQEIETPELLKAKGNRTRAEYCWTCESFIIRYVLDHFEVNNCIYIDSDLFFYKDPKILIDELSPDEHIIITPHRLMNEGKDKRARERYGTYCVEFNYFDQSKESRKALDWWIDSCIEWCYCRVEDGKYGDQKYLDSFQDRFVGIHVLQNLGGGVAPWNLKQYRIKEMNGNRPMLVELSTSKSFEVVFYHFQSIRFLSDNRVNIFSGTDDVETKNAIYIPYLKAIMKTRNELSKYGITFTAPIYHGKGLKAIYQKYLRPRLFSNKTDIIDLNSI